MLNIDEFNRTLEELESRTNAAYGHLEAGILQNDMTRLHEAYREYKGLEASLKEASGAADLERVPRPNILERFLMQYAIGVIASMPTRSSGYQPGDAHYQPMEQLTGLSAMIDGGETYRGIMTIASDHMSSNHPTEVLDAIRHARERYPMFSLAAVYNTT